MIQFMNMVGPVHFLPNKYRDWYFQLIQQAKDRTTTESTERHHIIPRSLGGRYSIIIRLTHREHFLAHWLLTKFTSGIAKKKMAHAFWAMTRRGNRNHIAAWQYELARSIHQSNMRANRFACGYKWPEQRKLEFSLAMTGRKFSSEHKAKIGLTALGNKRAKGAIRGAETRLKMSKPKSAATRAKMSASLLGNKRAVGVVRSPEQKQKLRDAQIANYLRKKSLDAIY